ncbi:MAG: AAA family ATPase [Patescibacteria group bacterium]|jgi:adenylate kinase family enzyme
MFISLIGMSGVGKSFWSGKLEKEKGFKRFGIDDMIEAGLESELKKLGYSGIKDMSRWLGQPYDGRCAENSRRYLELEAENLQKALDAVENGAGENIVIDTTGSVAYLAEKLIARMKKLTKIIYFDTPETVIEKKIKQYFDNPKPILWGKSYNANPGEDPVLALKRCYPELLKYRTGRYEKLADITIDYYAQMEKGYTVDSLFRSITKAAPRA